MRFGRAPRDDSRLRFAAAVGLAFLLGCSDRAEDANNSASEDAGGAKQERDASLSPPARDAGALPTPELDDRLTLATYNTGQAVVVQGVNERLAALPEALVQVPADVLCLQELFAPATTPTKIRTRPPSAAAC